MSATLVEQYSSDFTPEEFEDDYQVQLQALIEAKIEQGEELDTDATFGEVGDEGESGDVIDLMEALKRSIDGRKSKTAPKSSGKKKSAAEK